MRFTLNDIEVNLLHNCMFIEEMAERARERERERQLQKYIRKESVRKIQHE